MAGDEASIVCQLQCHLTVPHETAGNYYTTMDAASCAACNVAYKYCTCNNGTWNCVGGSYMEVYYTCTSGGGFEICDY